MSTLKLPPEFVHLPSRDYWESLNNEQALKWVHVMLPVFQTFDSPINQLDELRYRTVLKIEENFTQKQLASFSYFTSRFSRLDLTLWLLGLVKSTQVRRFTTGQFPSVEGANQDYWDSLSNEQLLTWLQVMLPVYHGFGSVIEQIDKLYLSYRKALNIQESFTEEQLSKLNNRNQVNELLAWLLNRIDSAKVLIENLRLEKSGLEQYLEEMRTIFDLRVDELTAKFQRTCKANYVLRSKNLSLEQGEIEPGENWFRYVVDLDQMVIGKKSVEVCGRSEYEAGRKAIQMLYDDPLTNETDIDETDWYEPVSNWYVSQVTIMSIPTQTKSGIEEVEAV